MALQPCFVIIVIQIMIIIKQAGVIAIINQFMISVKPIIMQSVAIIFIKLNLAMIIKAIAVIKKLALFTRPNVEEYQHVVLVKLKIKLYLLYLTLHLLYLTLHLLYLFLHLLYLILHLLYLTLYLFLIAYYRYLLRKMHGLIHC